MRRNLLLHAVITISPLDYAALYPYPNVNKLCLQIDSFPPLSFQTEIKLQTKISKIVNKEASLSERNTA